MPPYSRVTFLNRQARPFSTTSELNHEVRVRFAPSPTGSIHLGGLRTALYNYLFAKKFNGKFILRIEDTDQSRTVHGSIDDIQESLDWAGLHRHEGPREGGDYGPYIQSQRVDLYRSKAEELIQAGKAYRCFCSATRLELLRKQQAKNREPPHYDGKCRLLDKTEIDNKMKDNNGRHVVRFALEPGFVKFQDMVFGDTGNNINANIDSDPIILKNDGFPTYHLANVVDDHLMKISHVLRGSEWLASTVKHLSIYRAFRWDPPKFAHFPLITMGDGTKMSKRNEQSKVKLWVEKGYRPLAMVNFLTNMGGGLPKYKQDNHDIWTLDKIADNFDFSQVSSHPASVDIDRLKIFNAKELQLMWKDNPKILVDEFKSLLYNNSMETNMNDEQLIKTIDPFITRIGALNDLISPEYAYVWNPPEITWSKTTYIDMGWDFDGIVTDILNFVHNSEDLKKETVETELKSIAQKHNIEWTSLFRLTRKLLTNNDRGLPIHQIFDILGKDRSVEYLIRHVSAK